MNDSQELPRSVELMSRHDSALLVVDLQDKLIPAIDGGQQVVWNIRRLIDGATALGIPVAATEQYPAGLGPTVEEISSRLGHIPEKLRFSCAECVSLFETWQAAGIFKILLSGIEAHVCVQQTALDLLASGFGVYVAVDAIGSRYTIDCETALRRMDSAGATLTTTESALFEWCERAGSPEFKVISRLAREERPQ